MKIEEGIKLDFSDVLIRPKRSNAPSRSSVDLIRTFKCINSGRTLYCLPIIAANMSATGTFNMASTFFDFNALVALQKFHTFKNLLKFFNTEKGSDISFYSLGIKNEDFEKLDSFAKEFTPNKICLDAANGNTKFFIDKVKRLRERFPDAILMVGNIATPEMTQELILAGADIVKIGIGPGSACTTRIMTGVGVPQLSAIIDCADCAHGIGGLVCADGGCTTPGDVVKAFGAGADLVMLGGMLAGTSECTGEWVDDGFKFFGMASQEARDEFYNGMREDYTAVEGKAVIVPRKGYAGGVLRDIMGGLRSACTYVGAEKLKDLSKCTTFIRVSRTHNSVFED